MAPEKLIRMANQIARFMATREREAARSGFAAHINDYWEPRMRRELLALLSAQTNGFDALVYEAVALIRPPPNQT